MTNEVFDGHVESFEEPGDDESPLVHRSGANVQALLHALEERVNS